MRWNSGTSPSSAYQLKTPDAIIRPLGTVLDLLVESQRTMVVLRRGRIDVCSVGAPQRCRTLSELGEMIIATPSGLEGPKRGRLGQSEFADQCLSADAIPCVITASISPPVRPKRHAQDSRPVREQASVPREQPSRRVRVGCPSFPMSVRQPPVVDGRPDQWCRNPRGQNVKCDQRADHYPGHGVWSAAPRRPPRPWPGAGFRRPARGPG